MKSISLVQVQDAKIKKCIYAVRSRSGDYLYIGRTGRSLRSRIREHIKDNDRLGEYIRENKDVFLEIYSPHECVFAVERIYGKGWNPQIIGLVVAEECMIVYHKPILNQLYYKAIEKIKGSKNE